MAEQEEQSLLVQLIGVFRARFGSRYYVTLLPFGWLATRCKELVKRFVDMLSGVLLHHEEVFIRCIVWARALISFSSVDNNVCFLEV